MYKKGEIVVLKNNSIIFFDSNINELDIKSKWEPKQGDLCLFYFPKEFNNKYVEEIVLKVFGYKSNDGLFFPENTNIGFTKCIPYIGLIPTDVGIM